MGPHGLTDVAVEAGHVHQVLFANLLRGGFPCLVLVLPRLLRVYTVYSSAWGHREIPHEKRENAAKEKPLRFLCEMRLDASVLNVAVIPCSKATDSVSCSREGPPVEAVLEVPLCESDTSLANVGGGALASVHTSAGAWASHGPPDLLLLLFGGYRAAVVSYDEALCALCTVSMHSFAELEPRAAAVHALLTGPVYVKPVDEVPPFDVDERHLAASDGAPTVAAGQLPTSLLRSACKVHVFALDSFTASVGFGGPLLGRYGSQARLADSREFLAVLSVDLLHVVCLQLSVKTDGFRHKPVFGADGSAVAAAQADAAVGHAWRTSMQVEERPSHSRVSPLTYPLCHPPLSLTTAAATTSKIGGSSLLASPWSRGQGGPPSLGGRFLPAEREHFPASSARGPQSSASSHSNAPPAVAFLAAAVQRQQHRQEADGVDDVSTGSAASELGDAGRPSLWGTHSVLVSDIAIASCFFLSLLEDLPLPPPVASAVAGAAAPSAGAVRGDCAAAAANAASATAGAAGLPYVLLDLVGVASLLSPAVALLLAEGPRELGLLPFAGAPGAGEVFALLLAINPHEEDVQLVGKIPGLLGDTFRLLPVPGLADGLLCLSSNSLSFFSFRGGSCGGGTQQLLDSHQADSTNSNYNRTLGITHILHPAGLVRKDLVQLPSVVFDKSALRLRLDGTAAAFLRETCLFVLATDGRPALAHLVMPAGLAVTDFLWTSVEISSPAASVEGPQWGLPTLLTNDGLFNADGLRGQLLLPRSDSIALYPLEGSVLQETAAPGADDADGRATRSGSTRAAAPSRCLIALGGRIRDGTGVCLAVAEPEPVMTPRVPWGGASGTSRDLHCETTGLLADEALATGVASLETCCGLLSELNQGRARHQQQQELYTTSGKQLMELSPDGSIALAQQKAPILRHSELQEDEALWCGVTDKAAVAAPACLTTPFGYLRWLRMQQESVSDAAQVVEALRSEAAAHDSHDATAAGFVEHTNVALSAVAAAPSNFQSSKTTIIEGADRLLVDALGLARASDEGHLLLSSVRLCIVDRLSIQGLLSPRCVSYLPAPSVPCPLAAPAAQQPKEQTIEELCSTSGGSRYLLVGGAWPHGSLGALQRAVPCRSHAALTVAEGNPRIIWALQLAQQQSGLLLVSSDPRMGLGESRLFSFRGGALVDATTAGTETIAAGDKSAGRSIGEAFCKEAPTLFAASVLGGRVLLQLTADELRALDSSGSCFLCPPIDMNEDPEQQPQEQQQDQAVAREADAEQEASVNMHPLEDENAPAAPLHSEELPGDGAGSHPIRILDDATTFAVSADADESPLTAAVAGWEKEMPRAPGGLAAAVRGSAAENWVCVVLDDFRLRVWYIDPAAAGRAAEGVQPSSLTDSVPDASPLLHEVPLAAMPHCMRGRVKSAHLYAHARNRSALEDVNVGIPAASDVFCCLVTLEGPKQAQALHVVSLQQMKCIFSTVDLRLVSPLLRNCGSCSQHQMRQELKEHLHHQHFLYCQHQQHSRHQRRVELVDGVTASGSGRPSRATPTGGAADGVIGHQGGLQHYAAAIAAAADAAAANLSEEGLRDARRSVTCITASPLLWALPPDEPLSAASAGISDVGSISAAGGPEVVAASAGGTMEQAVAATSGAEDETKEEVLSAELLLLDPAEDAGPTLVVFLTGRPPLLYRAFCAVPASAASDGARVNELSSTRSKLRVGSPVRSMTAATSPVLVGKVLFPWSFRLVVNDCTDCIPSAQAPLFARPPTRNDASAAAAAPPEVSVHFAVSSGYTTVPQQASLLGGGVALVIPPLSLPEMDEAKHQRQVLERPPVLWLCSSRNQLYVHPNERRDSLSAAPFHWDGGLRGSFAFLCGREPAICLADVASPFESTCRSAYSAGVAAASSSVATGPRGDEAAAAHAGSHKMGPFRLDGCFPFSSFPLGASPTHVAVSSSSSYVQPPDELGVTNGGAAAQREAVAAPGRLVAVAVHHHTEETEQLREVLRSRNALQRAHLALQSRAGTGEAAGAVGEKGALDDGGLTAAAHPNFANSSSEAALGEGSLFPNPYLAACADGRVEVAGEVGKQQEVLLFHQDDLMSPLGSFVLGPCEEVMSLNFVFLDALEFLAVGVSQPLSEAVETGGRLLLLRLSSLVSYGQQSVAATASGETTLNEGEVLGLFCSFVFPGPVSAVGDFAPSGAERHYLLHSVGRRLFTHEIDGDLLARGAFADVGISITAVSTLKHFIVTGDLYKGISLLAWRFDASSDSRRLELVSRTIPHWLLPVTACDALTEKENLGLLASDPWGNIRFFSLNQTADPGVSILQQLQVLRCDFEAMESDSPIVAFKQLLSETGDVTCAGWSAEGGLFSFRLIECETAVLLRQLQEWAEMCLPSECGLRLTASRVPAGAPSPHLRLWAADQQQRLRQQLQQQLLQQYCSLDEDTAATSTALAAAAFASGDAAEASWLLQQLDASALAALRSYLPIAASQLRSFPFLSVPVQQRLVLSATPSLIRLLQGRFGAANEEEGPGALFSWAALRKALAAGPLRGFDLPAVPLS